MKESYILDACALIAYLNDETGADVVEGLLDMAASGDAAVSMGKINLLEVYYGILRDVGAAKADEILAEILTMPITIIGSMDDAVFREAGRLKASYKMSLADSLALAYASVAGAHIVTADHHELDVIERTEPIGFTWIR